MVSTVILRFHELVIVTTIRDTHARTQMHTHAYYYNYTVYVS